MLFSQALVLGSTSVVELRPGFFAWQGAPTDRPPTCACAIGTALIALGLIRRLEDRFGPINRAIGEWPYLGRSLAAGSVAGRFPDMARVAESYRLRSLTLGEWISMIHTNEVANRLEIAEWVAGLEREWGIVDVAPAPVESTQPVLLPLSAFDGR